MHHGATPCEDTDGSAETARAADTAQKGAKNICGRAEARRAQQSARQCWQCAPCSSSCSHMRLRALRPQAPRPPALRPRSRAATLSSSVAAQRGQQCAAPQAAPQLACALSGCAWSLWASVLPASRPAHPLGAQPPPPYLPIPPPLTIQEATRRRPSRSPYRSQAQCLGAARRRPTTRRSDEPAWTGTASSRSYVQGLAPRHRLRHRHRRPSPANATRRAATAPCATTGAGSACTTTSGAGFARAGGRRARAASTRERGRLTTRSLQTAST